MKNILFILLICVSCSKAPAPFQPSAETVAQMDDQSLTLHTVQDVSDMMSHFTLTLEIAPDNPSPSLVFYNKWQGDCKSASALAQWGCDVIGYNSMLVNLQIDPDNGHRVCIAWNKPGEWHLFSNKSYKLIRAEDWKTDTLEYFDGRYKRAYVETGTTHNQGSI